MEQGHFDYQSVSEEKEELDFSKLISCPKCKEPIPHDATMCLYCGEEVTFQEKKPWVVCAGVVLIIAFILFSLLR